MPISSDSYPIADNFVRLEKESSTDGRFAIVGEWGSWLDIDAIKKDGYEVEPDNCPHTFGVSSGTFESPLVFKMWSTNIHEQLITGDKSF